MRMIYAGLSGVMFGAGLAISGMTDPAKILNFLDVASMATGQWDPTLGVVFASALATMILATRYARSRREPWQAPAFVWPTKTVIDAKLVGGAALFGIGWGLVGLCPGPVLAGFGVVGEQWPALVAFGLAMAVGIVVGDRAARTVAP